jgi:hypothetical protein
MKREDRSRAGQKLAREMMHSAEIECFEASPDNLFPPVRHQPPP